MHCIKLVASHWNKSIFLFPSDVPVKGFLITSMV